MSPRGVTTSATMVRAETIPTGLGIVAPRPWDLSHPCTTVVRDMLRLSLDDCAQPWTWWVIVRIAIVRG